MGLDEAETALHGVDKDVLPCNQMVARGHYDTCLGIDCRDMVCCPGDAGSGIAAGRFEQNLAFGKFGELFPNERSILLVGYDEHILFRHERKDAVETHLEKSAAGSEKIYELLRTRRAAVGPETAADAATHDHAIAMLIYHHISVLVRFNVVIASR